jgi:methylmalonyl-CoA mutase N-terminal domain/subunit
MTIDQFAPQVSFFFYTHSDFFEEVAKYRAGRRRWARIVRERYGAKDDRSCMFRAGVVCGGASLYSPQPHNNIVRVAYEAMSAVLGGVQSMFTAAWDEPFALPTEESTTLALRTQQILAYETGVTRVTDPLGGSYYVEALTDAMEQRLEEIMADLDAYGGMVKAIEDGYVQRLISEEAYRFQQQMEAGDKVIVGVNRFTSSEPPAEVRGYEMDGADLARHLERLAQVRRERDTRAAARCLETVKRKALGDENLMPYLVEAVKAYCTIGEISNSLREVWGEFQQPVAF